MDNDRWQRLNEIFHAARALSREERSAFVSRACAGDESLRRESEDLLRAHDGAERDLGPIERLEITLDEPDSPGLAGQRLGPYRITDEIGRGGMGAVWLADRVDGQFEHRVAIKVIKRGMDTAQVLERFLAERQILASFDHPNIARLIDGGTTADGLPYFVMEPIQGQPIDEYADERRLSVRERLELFLPVCDAVSYAHRHLIIHRDIKPQNILVTTAGVPKLLDFGIAKVLQDAREQGTHTLGGFHPLTPDYASPEQVEGQPTTTQTDVYSLGVVLYELLTGRSPYRPRTWSTRDVCESVLTSDVERPSTAVGLPQDGGSARRRRAPVADRTIATGADSIDRLRAQLRGDLDAIVSSALRKEPARRYASVEQFAADIRRHLNGLPVRARPDSLRYRSAKFVRRNRAAVAVAVLLFVTLLGGAVATAWQAREARIQAQLAREAQARAERRFIEVRKVANALLFEYHDAIKDLPGATAVREKLVRDGLTYLDSLAEEASGDPALQRELASAYERMGDVRGQQYSASLGDVAGAQESYLKAIEIRESLVATQPQDVQSRRDLARSYVRIGSALIESEAARGTDYLRRGVEAYGRLAADEPADAEIRYELAGAYNDLGLALEQWGETSGALENQRKALALREQLAAADPENDLYRRNLAAAYMNLSRALVLSGDPESALESNQKGVRINAALFAEHPDNATYRRRLAISYQNDGDYRSFLDDTAGALDSFRRKLALDEQALAEDPANAQSHGDLGYTCERLGTLLAHSGQNAQAVQYFRRAVASWEELLARSPQNLMLRYGAIVSRAGLAETQAKLGERSAAVAECSRAIALLGELADDPAHSAQRGLRGLAYLRIARAHAALATSKSAVTAEQREHWRTARHMYASSLAIWQDMQQRGILTGDYATKPQEVAREIARHESLL